MAGYDVNKSDPNATTPVINVPDGQLGSLPQLPIDLVGRNYINYSPAISTIQVHMLENFASPTEPGNGITGQLWYDKSLGVLKFASADDPAVVWEELIHDGMDGAGYTIGNSGPNGSFDEIYGTDIYGGTFYGNIGSGNFVGDFHYGDQVALTPLPTNLICHVDPDNFGTSYVWKAVLPDDTLISFMQVTEFPSGGLMNTSWGIKGTKAPQIAMSNDDAETAPFMQLKVGDNTLKTFITLNEDKIDVTGDMHFSSDSSAGDPSRVIFRDDGTTFDVNTIEWEDKNGNLISYMRGWHPIGIPAPNVNKQHAEFEMPIPGSLTYEKAGISFTHDFDDGDNRAQLYLANKDILITDDEIRIDAADTRIRAVSDFYLGYENSWDTTYSALVFQDANGSQNGAGMVWKRDDGYDFASLTGSYYTGDNSYSSTWAVQAHSVNIIHDNTGGRIKIGGGGADIHLQHTCDIKSEKTSSAGTIMLMTQISDTEIGIGESGVDVLLGDDLIIGNNSYGSFSGIKIKDTVNVPGATSRAITWQDTSDNTISFIEGSRDTGNPVLTNVRWAAISGSVTRAHITMNIDGTTNLGTMQIEANEIFIGANDFKTDVGASGEVLTANGDGTVSWGFTAEGPGGANWLNTAGLLGTATNVPPALPGEYSPEENFQGIIEQAAGRAIYTVSGPSNTTDTMNPVALVGQESPKTLFDGLTIYHVAEAPTVGTYGRTLLYINAFGLGSKPVYKTSGTDARLWGRPILTTEIYSGAFYTYSTKDSGKWLMQNAIGNQHLLIDSYLNLYTNLDLSGIGSDGNSRVGIVYDQASDTGILTKQNNVTADWDSMQCAPDQEYTIANLQFSGLDAYGSPIELNLDGEYELVSYPSHGEIILKDVSLVQANWTNSGLSDDVNTPSLNTGLTTDEFVKMESIYSTLGIRLPNDTIWSDYEKIELVIYGDHTSDFIVGTAVATREIIARYPRTLKLRAYSWENQYAGIEASGSGTYHTVLFGDRIAYIRGWLKRDVI